MYRMLLGVPVSAYVFLSGLMVSVATSAAAQVSFAEHSASNGGQVLISGFLALMAGIVWFLLSENIGSAVRKVDAFAPALRSRGAALGSLPRRSRITANILFLLAVSFSLLWPWVGQLNALIRCVCRYPQLGG